ncbi:hypothetical protein KUTeg_006386 [Tegillarca granosa]|uniref:F5/8 type C domain-containing protein n=1 Tax=Tegillarca granosa TaxID=220873 RepID=A0ABQ9FGB9_TEGGR|nr:hypothetical protein KUTeg_006386 [Tegillarca granosa]
MKGTIMFSLSTNVCDQYLVSGPNGVPDSAFNASSVYHVNDPKHVYGPERGRLNLTETKDSSGNTLIGAWSADKLDVNQYIQVELKDPSLIRGIVTQGRHGCCKQWIKKYRVLYSLDCKNFTAVGDHNSTDAVGHIINIILKKDFQRILPYMTFIRPLLIYLPYISPSQRYYIGLEKVLNRFFGPKPNKAFFFGFVRNFVKSRPIVDLFITIRPVISEDRIKKKQI